MNPLDLRARLLALVDPLRPGDEVEGARLIELSTELGLRLRFEHRGEPLDVEVTPLDSTDRFAASSTHFAFGYRTEGGRLEIDPTLGRRLCEAVAKRVSANEGGLSAPSASSASSAPRIREVRVERLLERAGFGSERFYTLSPYVGCLVGCRFCYAQSKLAPLRRWAGLPDVPWGSYVDARINAPEVLARELQSLPVRPIKFCPIVSDPYQPIETKLELTGRCLDVLAGTSFPVLILTRTTSILRDLERLAKLDAWVGVSLPTIDDEVRRHFEPRAASIPERLHVLQKARDAGLRTLAVVQPMLPGDESALADALASHADSVSLDVLRGVEGAAEQFADARYAHAAGDTWQRTRATTLQKALEARDVPVWAGELPPEIDPRSPR